jgi:hypothetical protein
VSESAGPGPGRRAYGRTGPTRQRFKFAFRFRVGLFRVGSSGSCAALCAARAICPSRRRLKLGRHWQEAQPPARAAAWASARVGLGAVERLRVTPSRRWSAAAPSCAGREGRLGLGGGRAPRCTCASETVPNFDIKIRNYDIGISRYRSFEVTNFDIKALKNDFDIGYDIELRFRSL